MAKKGERLVDKLPLDARYELGRFKFKLRKKVYKKKEKPAYTKEKYLEVHEGYDAFENFMVIRNYIQKKYKISLRLLEILLYFYPKNYFTQRDYGEFPKCFTFTGIENMMERKWFAIAVTGSNLDNHVYCLTPNARHIVEKFYKLLAGGELMPDSAKKGNPLGKHDATAYDKKVLALTKKLNNFVISDTKKGLW